MLAWNQAGQWKENGITDASLQIECRILMGKRRGKVSVFCYLSTFGDKPSPYISKRKSCNENGNKGFSFRHYLGDEGVVTGCEGLF